MKKILLCSSPGNECDYLCFFMYLINTEEKRPALSGERF